MFDFFFRDGYNLKGKRIKIVAIGKVLEKLENKNYFFFNLIILKFSF